LTARSGCHMVLIAAILVLPAAPAQAGDKATLIPIFSGSDGSRACVEVSRSGQRAEAVPVLEIPGDTVRRPSTADGTGPGQLAPPEGVEGEEGKGQVDAGKFLKRHRSLLFREGPEGVSLGNGFDLLGDIQDALRKRRKTRKEQEGFVSTRKNATGDREPVSGLAEHAEIPGTAHPGDSRSRLN
jgi:hypothetical protein